MPKIFWPRRANLDPEISLATTYRTLPMLLDSHLIREVELNREHRYYEVNREQSPAAFHIICADCEQVIQVQDECIMLRERFLANSLGFKPLKLNVRIEANCLDLHEKGTCERRAKGKLSRAASDRLTTAERIIRREDILGFDHGTQASLGSRQFRKRMPSRSSVSRAMLPSLPASLRDGTHTPGQYATLVSAHFGEQTKDLDVQPDQCHR